ncbi:MAG: hypothetical protein CUN49_00345 [Candidatus Thermofonsia Clade 1 bacterium]|jgi:hypothetical protein|uniref:Uncharacterized protein n=1 Tax=Candidatus Thermofonsia Clade 1 bacterium TaxID=2364210 RepID=A0A2M8PIN7_9CHLR|nr:MAG: hypothetical protein CUN49_00345 [Candidatus Thermofonsia Clade 1 bacterium]PJF43185.1 MAG: hypothetical protein CUN50_01200 [Candidatus Thermofonsia Clade 1 bacterium]RMF52341.1 MAG: hypothetical protein D6749_05250 [Chloroflexota bacterium]
MAPEIRFGVVGRVQGGPYNDWYIYIRLSGSPEAPESAYMLYGCTDATFTFTPERNGYFDLWLENYAALEASIARHFPAIAWQEQIAAPRFQSSARLRRLIQRLRTRITPAEGSSATDQSDSSDEKH